MSPHFWSRVVVSAAVAVVAPLLVADAAHAAPAPAYTPAGSQQLVFTGGGLLGLTCAAVPSAQSITVSVGSTLRVVNKTGRRARLSVNDVFWGEVADGSSVDLWIERGPVSLSLKPTCLLSGGASVTVQVVAPTPAPTPTTAPPPKPTPKQTPQSGGAAQVTPGASASSTPSQRGALPPSVPLRGVAEVPPDTTPARAPVDPRPEPPGSAPAESPMAASPMAADPTAPDSIAPDIAPEPISESVVTVESAVVAKPKPQPARRDEPPFLLALIATICVIGVSAGAIQAILAQRATRTGRA